MFRTLLCATGSENYLLSTDFLTDFVCNYFDRDPLDKKKLRLLSKDQQASLLEDQRLSDESNERLRSSIRGILNGFTVKTPFAIGSAAKKQWINESKFVELMMSLGNNLEQENEAENYKYFCMRFWMRMRKDKSIKMDGEVPVKDLVDFLMTSKNLLPRIRNEEFAHAIMGYSGSK
jgi:dGTP triphosphohydrolase